MDAGQFTGLMQRYQAYVYTICYRFVGQPAAAEDLAQETFLAAYLHRDACPPGAEKPWLARIAANKAKDYLRSGWHRRVGLTEEPPQLPAAADGPQTALAVQLQRDAVRRAVCGLPPPYHDVAVLVFLQDYTPQQAAAMTRRPLKTVYTQLARAKALLAPLLQEEASICE